MSTQVQSSTPGVFGSYFTLSKAPQTPQEKVRHVTLLALGFMCVAAAIVHQKNNGLFNDIVLVPIYEEILYRGACTGIANIALNLIQGTPKTADQEQARKTARTVITAAVFANGHSEAQLHFHYFWFLGRATGYLKEETGGYILPIALHMTYNFSISLENLINKDVPVNFIAIPVTAIALLAMKKNINPLRGLWETYNYFTSK